MNQLLKYIIKEFEGFLTFNDVFCDSWNAFVQIV